MMRIKAIFGLTGSKEAIWWQPIMDFPKVVKYLGRNFEWVFYDSSPKDGFDYVLTFAELPSYDPNYGIDYQSWEDLFAAFPEECECGSKYDKDSPNMHMQFCKLFKRN